MMSNALKACLMMICTFYYLFIAPCVFDSHIHFNRKCSTGKMETANCPNCHIFNCKMYWPRNIWPVPVNLSFVFVCQHRPDICRRIKISYRSLPRMVGVNPQMSNHWVGTAICLVTSGTNSVDLNSGRQHLSLPAAAHTHSRLLPCELHFIIPLKTTCFHFFLSNWYLD